MQEQSNQKVNISENTVQKVSKKNNSPVTIQDSLGRQIVLKRQNVLQQFKLVEILGSETSQNVVYMQMVGSMLFVNSIDGIAVCVTTKSELEALITRLDDEGVVAVMKGVQEHFGVKNEEEANEKIKK